MSYFIKLAILQHGSYISSLKREIQRRSMSLHITKTASNCLVINKSTLRRQKKRKSSGVRSGEHYLYRCILKHKHV